MSIVPSTETKTENTETRTESTETPKIKKPRGFAALKLTNPNLVSEIARKGGQAAHQAGTAHEFSQEEAREAGRKGGRAFHSNRKSAPSGEK